MIVHTVFTSSYIVSYHHSSNITSGGSGGAATSPSMTGAAESALAATRWTHQGIQRVLNKEVERLAKMAEEKKSCLDYYRQFY